ncbi:MAG: hypothetical protein PF569_07355 [Candidatus Woesearchaeota archaeon]|jgi:hypothetical protein|nr:hypothetical protein [Candidatus Woesearchaeota archaeon]
MKKIELSKSFKNKLALRSTARHLFDIIIEENITTLDFKNIEFISRSFANELLKLEKETKLKLEKINMSSNVSFMIKFALENRTEDSKTNYKIGNLDNLIAL